MNARATFALLADTFREALARKIFWGLFGLSALLITFFLFVMKIDVVAGATATVSLFGRNAGPVADVHRLIQGVYGFVAVFLYTWGMFLAVFASAGLIPNLLEPGRIELLLSKPVSRIRILLGRYLGNLLVVGANTIFLVLGVWTIFGWKTGLWPVSFLIAIPTTVFIFSVLLAVVALVGVLWESTALAVMVPVALMIMSPILAQEKLARKLLSSEWSRDLWKALYVSTPRVFDVGFSTLATIRDRSFGSLEPLWTSAAFGLVMLTTALIVFARRDF
jgi:ABC-type transport system involved in multi-copper enzyme maturation permease subunit